MKPTQILLPAATGILGLLLGLALAPTLRKPGNEMVSTSSAGLPKTAKSTDVSTTISQEDGKTKVRPRARERVEDKKPKEPRVSIPLKSVVQILKDKEFDYFSDFDRLDYNMEKALVLLGATESEQEEIKALLKKSESEILAAEKTHVKLGEVTSDLIWMDMSGMRGSAEDIAERTKDGIRATLPADLAEGLISAINWGKYYPVDEKSFTRLEITRDRSGRLMAWEREGGGGTGRHVDPEFKDDGTPLPAERIFEDRWKPFLKGVTILPKDEE